MLKRILPLIAVLFVACGDSGVQFENYCVGVDCGSHGRCAIGAEGPICICDTGFTLQEGACKESVAIDPCKDVVCEGNGTCAVAHGNTAVCLCRPGYQSDGAQCVKGDEVSDSPCDGVTCGGHGSCIVTSLDKALCICDEGYRLSDPTTCTVIDGGEAPDSPCKSVTCSYHGTCVVSGFGEAICICDHGYRPSEDLTCIIDDGGEEHDSACKNVTCGNYGTCVVSGTNEALCICNDGYYRDGLNCVPVVDPCSGVTCGDNGTCVVSAPNEALCICNDGYYRDDLNCVPDADPCSEATCGDNGTCVVSGTNEALCICNDGYYRDDLDCVPNADPCSGVTCSRHGTCVVSGSNEALCICDDGYRRDGLTCTFVDDGGEAPDSPCKNVTCGNYGTCVVSGGNEALCICYDGYHRDGLNCVPDVDPCSGVSCGNYGTCVVSGANEALCICNDGYHRDGLNCVPDADPCSGVTCSNRGTCVVSGSGTALCICNDGYRPSTGLTCVAVENPCSGVTCSYHGTCVVSGSGDALCICDEGYRRQGNNCVKFIECSVSSNCTGGWCLIPACTFEMGTPGGEACRFDWEGPVHSVTITRPFYMKQTEVTQEEWNTLISNNPSKYLSCGASCPVERVTWFDAVYYANRLSQDKNLEQCYILSNSTGTPGGGNYYADVTFKGLDCKGYRLPTEAEFEFATRAGTTTAYWIGGNITDGGQPVCVWDDNDAGISLHQAAWYSYNSGDITHKVGQKAANPFGLYDVHGNVSEWVNDWFDFGYYRTCAGGCEDPLGPPSGGERSVRGGSWTGAAKFTRSGYRGYSTPTNGIDYVGFRLVRTAP